MNFKEITRDILNRNHLVQDREKCRAGVNMMINLRGL
jgi:hypothetical protein